MSGERVTLKIPLTGIPLAICFPSTKMATLPVASTGKVTLISTPSSKATISLVISTLKAGDAFSITNVSESILDL